MADAENAAPEIVKKPLKFIHLRIHTDFSLIDGLQHVEKYCEIAGKEHWAALSVTDHMNVFGLVRLYELAAGGGKKHPGGVKPIAAVDLNIHDGEDEFLTRLTVLCMNENGYHNMCEIMSRAWVRGPQDGFDEPAVELSWFTEKNSHGTSLLADDLIVLSGGREGALGRALLAGNEDRVAELTAFYKKYFSGRFYLELIRTGRDNEERCVQASVAYGIENAIPVVATNDVMFMKRDDFDCHEVRVCNCRKEILSDPTRPKLYSREQYLKSQEQMEELFSDIPSALENTVEIAKRCNVYITLGKLRLPKFPVPKDFKATDEMVERVWGILERKAEADYKNAVKKAEKDGKDPSTVKKVDVRALEGAEKEEQEELIYLACYLIWMSETGLEERLKQIYRDHPDKIPEERAQFDERLAMELEVIIGMGFPGYFLIVMEFIQWSKENGIPIGPGRGSGAGSLVAYSIKITDLNPLEFALLFERFLNPERVSMPDFDIDICMSRRGEVIQHVAELYGRDAVSQIATFGSMAAKAAIKDVARVLNMSYTFGDKLAKLIPAKPGTTIDSAFSDDPDKGNPEFAHILRERYETEPEVKTVIDMSKKLEGVIKSTGKHAGGVVISPTTIVDYSPLICDDEGNPVTQYDKHDIENAGLVKFDFLGLKTLTLVQWALDTIKERNAKKGLPPVDISKIPLDDEASFRMLLDCETTAVFQLESQGMRNLIAKLKPDHFEDMIALVALFRPGPLDSGMVDNFINRKHGLEEIAYPMPEYQHPCLEPILAPTYGVVVYQEQVMQLAQALSGYTLGGADMLRRAMGKKIPEEMVRHRGIFVDGAQKLGRDPDVAGKIYDIVEKFAGYGFNKSHSAAYALVAYQTLWLKTHYPAEFLAAMMTGDCDNKDKIISYVAELKRLGIKILPPDINLCKYAFTVSDEGEVVYGMSGVTGLGEFAMKDIVDEREAHGPFADLFDFCVRITSKRFNQGLIEKLIWVGAFDKIGPHRAALIEALPEAMKYASQKSGDSASGQLDLFAEADGHDPYRPKYREVPKYPDRFWLEKEKEYLGLYLTGHPAKQYEKEGRFYAELRLRNVRPQDRREKSQVTVAGYATAARVFTTKKGTRMASMTLEEETGSLDVLVFAKTLENCEEQIKADTYLIVRGSAQTDRQNPEKFTFFADDVQSVTEARRNRASCIEISLDESQVSLAPDGGKALQLRLLSVLQNYSDQAGLPIKLCYYKKNCCMFMDASPVLNATPSDELLNDLRLLLGNDKVRLRFPGD